MGSKSLIKREDLRAEITSLHVNDISDAKLSLDVTLVCAVLRMVRLTSNLLPFRYFSVSFGLVIFKEEK